MGTHEGCCVDHATELTYERIVSTFTGNSQGTGALLRTCWRAVHDLSSVGAMASLFCSRGMDGWEDRQAEAEAIGVTEGVTPRQEAEGFFMWTATASGQSANLIMLTGEILVLGAYLFSGGPLPEGCGDTAEAWCGRSQAYANDRQAELSWYTRSECRGTWSDYAVSAPDSTPGLMNARRRERTQHVKDFREVLTPEITRKCAELANNCGLATFFFVAIVRTLTKMVQREDFAFMVQSARHLSDTFTRICSLMIAIQADAEALVLMTYGPPPETQVH